MAIPGLFVQRPNRRRDDVPVVKPKRYETKDALLVDIAAAQDALSDLVAIELDWRQATQPVRNALKQIGLVIRRTHFTNDDMDDDGHRVRGESVIGLNRAKEAKAERLALFEESDGIHRKYAPELREFDLAKRGAKQAKDTVNTLRSILKHWKEPKPEKPTKQVSAALEQMRLF